MVGFEGASDKFKISSSYVVRLTTGEEDETTAGAGVVWNRYLAVRCRSKWPRVEATDRVGLILTEKCICESKYRSEAVALAKCA
jgi:hypothetical protein